MCARACVRACVCARACVFFELTNLAQVSSCVRVRARVRVCMCVCVRLCARACVMKLWPFTSDVHHSTCVMLGGTQTESLCVRAHAQARVYACHVSMAACLFTCDVHHSTCVVLGGTQTESF